jgi:hypothetical protein
MPEGIVPIDPNDLLGGGGLTTPDFAPGVALERMEEKTRELGFDIAGVPLVGGLEGVEFVTGGFRRHHEKGTMYVRTGDAGTPFFLNRVIEHRYDLLGNTRSFLGFPISDFKLDPNDPESGVATFEGGDIYFWKDLGAIEIHEVSVRFVAFHCFGETDELSGSDEVYLTFGVVPLDVSRRATHQTRIHNQVDAGDTRPDLIDLYTGPPGGLVISVNLAEHDEGDPEAYKDQVDAAVDKAAEGVVAALGEIPVLGVPLALTAEVLLFVGGPALKEEINDLLGTEDDHVGTVEVVLSTKDLLRLTREPPHEVEGTLAHVESPLISGDGASYKAYFEVLAV